MKNLLPASMSAKGFRQNQGSHYKAISLQNEDSRCNHHPGVARKHADMTWSTQNSTLSPGSSHTFSHVSVNLYRLAPRSRWIARSILSPFLSRPKT